MRIIFLALIVSVIAVPAMAKKASGSNYEQTLKERSPFQQAAAEFPWMTDEEFAKKKKSAMRTEERGPAAQSGLSENALSPKMRELRDRYQALASAEALDQFLAELDRNYDSYPNDVKFFAALIEPLRSVRGVVWRVIPYVEKTKITHSYLLSGVQQWASSMKVYFPTQEWKTGFDYVTQPYVTADNKTVAQFNNDADFHSFVAGEVYNALSTAAKRLRALQLDEAHPVILDGRLFYGNASFPDDLDRFRALTTAEVDTVLASIHNAMASIAFGRAYNMDGALQLAQQFGYLFGVDGFKADMRDYLNPLATVSGVTAQSRVTLLRKRQFANFGTLMPDGAQWADLAFKNLRASANYASLAYQNLKNRPHSNTTLIDPASVIPGMRQTDLTFENVEAMLKQQTVIRSVVTGETVAVDLPAFFQHPPSDLKALLPTGFDNGPKTNPVKLANGETVQVRNYTVGSPSAWNLQAFHSFLPDAQNNSDIPRAARILSQSFGGGLLTGPLSVVTQ